MGLLQAVAVVPGISRSGATVVGGLRAGVKPEEAAAFSFLMAVPAIGGASLLQLGRAREALQEVSGGALLGGGLAAAATGVLAIALFLRFVRGETLHRFAPYCWLAGSAFLAFLLLR